MHLTYLNRAFEWTHLKKVVVSWLCHAHLEEKIDKVDLITIGWKHLPSIKEMVYFPKSVFYDFEVLRFKALPEPCACSHKRWVSFLDPNTLETGNSMNSLHVRTANLMGIQNKELRDILTCGLNHIPLHHTNLSEVVTKLLFAWSKIGTLLNLSKMESEAGNTWLSDFFWHGLKMVASRNLGGFKFLQSGELSSKAFEELKYLTQHFYISGIDKDNNIAIICIRHIRIMALERL